MESCVATNLLQSAMPLVGNARDHRALYATIGDARIVLLGEATHGTHEFYRQRAEITKRLITEHGFNAVCIEGDWPDAYRVNRYVRGAGDDPEAVDSLGGFKRFPTWMWRNAEVLDFVSWLREYNDRARSHARPKVGFYGLDLYSMYASIDAVLIYLDRVDPLAAGRARQRYECLRPFVQHPEEYGMATSIGIQPSCRAEVLDQLKEIQRHASRYAQLDGRIAEDQYFYAEQNARIVANAERYYAALVDGSAITWNLRDSHMSDTLERLTDHLSRYYAPVKTVVWAHNSHVGDARATSMSLQGETNIGALLKSRYNDDVVAVGFTTHRGTVTAAKDWHAPAECVAVLPARPDSYEHLMHALTESLGTARFLVPLRLHRPSLPGLPKHARERAIGVVYRPQTELQSHYFIADLLGQFDVVYHFDVTRAVEPLEKGTSWRAGEPPETYPSGQ